MIEIKAVAEKHGETGTVDIKETIEGNKLEVMLEWSAITNAVAESLIDNDMTKGEVFALLSKCLEGISTGEYIESAPERGGEE